MFQFGILLMVFVFTVGYIFFTVSGEREEFSAEEDYKAILSKKEADAA